MLISKSTTLSDNLAAIKQLRLSLIFILIALFVLLVGEVAFSSFDETALAISTCFLIIFCLYLWSNTDTINIVIGITLWSITILSVFLSWQNKGLFDASILTFPGVILLALVLGSKALSISIIIFIQIVVVFFMYAHNIHLIPIPDLSTSSLQIRAIDINIVISLFSIISFIYVRQIKTSLIGFYKRNKELQDKLDSVSRLANYDTLTKLPNERICKTKVQTLVRGLSTSNKTLSFMILNLQNLKSINNSLGQEVGDELLIRFSKRITSLIKENEFIYRFNSVEFVLLSLSSNHEEIEVFKDKILQASSLPFYIQDYEIELFIAIGISVAPFDGNTIEVLRKKSHLALYQENNKNINTHHYYDEKMSSTKENKYQLIQALKSAISNNELELFYQPKVNLKTGKVTGAEALIRWHCPKRGMVPPDIFIPIAEESGIILDITKWVINTACVSCMQWHDLGLRHLNIAINLSTVDFRRGNLPQIVLKALQSSGLSPHYLELEITESMIVDDVIHIQNQIHQLHDKGVTFAIDDFGTGYSNLGYLSKFNVTTLKIDQSFIRNIHQSEHDLLIVKAIINMSRSLGISNVAEGVEDKNAAVLLNKENCEYGQGYFWSRPLKHDDFIKFSLAAV